MKQNAPSRTLTAALAGNPNSGKTTLFNALTGSAAYVGNWPGVTVEKKSGEARFSGKSIRITDLPGVYSLEPYSPEEAIAGKYLSAQKPDVIINIVDASNLERNLYLTTQLMELDIPMVIALNMMDVVRRRGGRIDCALFSSLIGIRVVPVSASRGEGLDKILKAAVSAAGKPVHYHRVPKPAAGCLDPETALADARYRYIESLTHAAVRARGGSESATERIDRVVTNRVLAIPIFIGAILAIFGVTFGPIGTFLVNGVDFLLFSRLSPLVEKTLSSAGTSVWVRGLVVDGILAGLGAVLRFLPQILLLFVLLSLLEDSGYMARAAFIMDAPMRRIGLSGRAFVPLLMGFGCTVPAVMGTRILEREKDKRLTILITPFMSCSAKTPVYLLFAAAFFAEARPFVMLALYGFGVLMGILSALLLKNSVLKGEPAPFLMELPDYRMPTLTSVWRHVERRVKDFLQKAGTTVFAAAVVIWLLQSVSADFRMTSDSGRSLLAAGGKFIAPVFSLCGFGTWKPSVALLTGLVAKESVVSSLNVLYSGGLTGALRTNFTGLSACSFLVFVLLYTPCVAALSTIRRETGSIKWAAASAVYQFATAWYCSALVYQCGLLLGRFFP